MSACSTIAQEKLLLTVHLSELERVVCLSVNVGIFENLLMSASLKFAQVKLLLFVYSAELEIVICLLANVPAYNHVIHICSDLSSC